jgi:hypothetical protein
MTKFEKASQGQMLLEKPMPKTPKTRAKREKKLGRQS